jgi:bifunctional non-homologous end joining protein LigD
MKIRVGRNSIELTNPDKNLFGDTKVDKQELAEYYAAMAPVMLPHLRGRPLAMERFPDGVYSNGFIQKEVPPHVPEYVHHATVDRVGGGTITMIVCDNAPTLVYLAQHAAIALHPWLSRTSRPRWPDRLIFDLDPDGDDFATVRLAARTLHGILDDIGLPSFPMTTGSRGVHVIVPIAAREDFDTVRAFARDVAEVLVRRHPDKLTTEARRNNRNGRLYVDTLRNAYAQHSIAPYSVRPLPGAPVATPLRWDELDDRRLNARRFTIRDVTDRASDDPWHGVSRGRVLLRPAEKLARLRSA